MQRLEWLLTPSLEAVLFALRLCVAIAAALYLAMWLELERPYWAALEVAVMMQPLPGMAVVRGLARAAGTVIASVIGLLIMALFAQSYELSVAALALWVAACSFGASLIRGDLGYGFAIAGFIAGITVLLSHALDQPPFDVAVARASECVLAAVVSAIVQVLLSPPAAARGYFNGCIALLRELGSELRRLARSEDRDSSAPSDTSVSSGTSEYDPRAALNALVGQALALEGSRRYAVYESPNFANFNRMARRLDYDLLALISAVSSLHIYISHRLGQLDASPLIELGEPAEIMRSHPHEPERIKVALDRTYERMLARARAPASHGKTRSLADWVVLSRAIDLVSRLRAAIIKHSRLIAERAYPSRGEFSLRSEFSHPVDVKHALRNAARTLVAVGLGGAVWVNFHDQLPAVILVILLSVLTTIFALLPNPIAAVGGFARGLGMAAVAAFVVDFLLLPGVNGFAMLMLCMLPVVFVGGLAMSTPNIAVALPGRISIVMFSLLVHVQNGALPSFTTYAQIVMGIAMAVTLAVLSFRLVLPVSPRQRLREQLFGVFDELARGTRLSRQRFETRMYERLNELALDVVEAPVRFSARQAVMAALNMGLEARGLLILAERADFPAPLDQAIRDKMAELEQVFAGRRPDLDRVARLQRATHNMAGRMIAFAVEIEDVAQRRLAIRASVAAELVASALADYALAFETGDAERIQLGARSSAAE